jgi:anti-sigma B factor antagonist
MADPSPEPFHLEELPGARPGGYVLRLSGPLLMSSLFPFQRAVRSSDRPHLILDFTAVPYLDSAGLGAVVGAYVTHNQNGRSLALVGVNDRIRNLFKATHVDQFFRFFPTVTEAEQA